MLFQIGQDVDEDPRLKVLRKEWFEGKEYLDIGCNNGIITIQIGIFLPISLTMSLLEFRICYSFFCFRVWCFNLAFKWDLSLFEFRMHIGISEKLFQRSILFQTKLICQM
uniref:RNA methyltransferase n=1 Tax=Cajanus cajan TaxID=3821 RepID=A0A151RTQ0_CAJCA|nr:hypothetical protein KK1_032486 [Cajanus cajan]